MQMRERSRRARRTGSDGEDSRDHVQNTTRGVVSSAPSRRSSKRSSVGKVPVYKNGEQREILKNTQVENAVEVEVIRVERIFSDIASLSRQSAQSDSSVTTDSAAREKETQDSSKSEADHLNDMLKRANLVRAVLMHDVDTIQRVISVLRRRVNQSPASTRKEIGTSIVNRDAKPLSAVIDAATLTVSTDSSG